MKNLLLISFFIFFIYENSYSSEIIDCTKFAKLKDKVECKAKNIKTKLNEKQSAVKKKIKDIDESESVKKMKKSTIGQKLIKFKNSKTGSEFSKKE
tara:strand:- start:669 stop:956 length:288 start_codon:yes stop_codon:yes gene_type:complete